jgi:predicted acylesterase/phospholipase RssA
MDNLWKPDQKSTVMGEYRKDGLFRILSLDGGGAKGFYTLGVLKEIEGMLGCALYHCFDLVFGTSTGSIIGVLIALGYEVDHILELYRTHVPAVMGPMWSWQKSAALKRLAADIFGDATFADVRTRVGVVATKWVLETPMIFKGSADQAHGRQGTFVPGFGAKLGDAVRASCSAYPFFKRTTLNLSAGRVELADGGFCANNPTLYAIADGLVALGKPPENLRVVSVGVGVYPARKRWGLMSLLQKFPSIRLLQKVLEINTQSMEQLRALLFKTIRTVRISDSFNQPEMATDFIESDQRKLDLLWQRGRESFASREATLREYLIPAVAPPAIS